MMFNILFTPFFFLFFLQFLNEWPSRVAPLVRLPPVAEMTPLETHALDVYVSGIRDLFAKWKAFKGHGPS